MKKFGVLALLLMCVAGFTLGCEKPKDKAAPADTPADTAPADDAAAPAE